MKKSYNELRRRAIFHFPRMIENVPSNSARSIRSWPLSAGWWLEERLSNEITLKTPLRAWCNDGSQLSSVGALGFDDVLLHWAAIATAASRTFLQGLRSVLERLVEVAPTES
jgi:hypothetical protein